MLDHGTPGQRKAVIESHVAEIKIKGTALTSIYKIPISFFEEDDEGSADDRPTLNFAQCVIVGLTHQNAKTIIAVRGDPLATMLTRMRRV